MDDTLFGIILLENPFIRNEDVERCLQIQSLGGWRKPIGQILLEEGVISEETLSLVLSIQAKRRDGAKSEGAPGNDDSAIPEFPELLERARARGATDVLLALGRRPRARIGGRIRPLSSLALDRRFMNELLRAFLDPDERERLAEQRHVVTRLRESAGESCRVTVFHDSYGPSVSIRVVPGTVPSLQALGHPSVVERLLENKRGLALVSGGPRSGKSTTIAAMVDRLAKRGAGHIVVLDEYHEYAFANDESLVTRKRVPHDGDALAGALRASFREDPDVIVIGDLVGIESVELCMQLASTGHLVIAGVEAPSSIAALRRLEDGVPEQMLPHFRANLASELLGLVYQDLVPSAKSDDLVLVQEVIPPSKTFRWAIAEGRLDRVPILLSFDGDNECVPLDDCLMDLVESGTIAIEEAFARARDRHRFLMTAG